MNKTMIKTMLMFALAILGGSVWAEVPQPVYTWDGVGGTATEETVFGKTVYTLNDGKVINATDTIPNGIPAKNFTFSMWTKKRPNPNWKDVCGFADSSYQFKLEENSNGGLYVYGTIGAGLYADNDARFIPSADYSDQKLQLLTVVQNNGIVYGYINGVLKMTSLESTTWEALKSDTAKMTYFAWGCAPNTNETADRPDTLSVADVSIYDVALTDAQVMELYYSYLGVATVPTMTIGGEGNSEVNWSTVENWAAGNVAVSGSAKIILQGNATLSIDQEIGLNYISVEGDYTLTVKRTLETGTTRISNLIAQKDIVMATDDIQVEYFGCPVIYTSNVSGLRSSFSGITYAAGAGSSESFVGMSLVGGSATLTGSNPFYLVESYSATATDVTFDGAQVVYGGGTYQDGTTRSNLSLGTANYVIKGSSNVSAQRMVLSQGADGQTSVITVQDESVVNITGNNNVDGNTASIMFGHWNGPSTFNLEGNAAFVASSADILVGLTRNNQTININGGTFTARGIKASSGATGTNTLNLNGGVLKLGETGIASYGNTVINVNVSANSEIRAFTSQLPITQPMVVEDGVRLSLSKVDGIDNTIVTAHGEVTGTGEIFVDAGVTLNLGTTRPESEITVDDAAVLALVLADKADVPVLNVSGKPNNIILYDTDGTTSFSDISVSYDAEAGTITVQPPVNTWNVKSDYSFDNSMNWSLGVPEDGEDVVIKAESDVTLSVTKDYALRNIFIAGAGTVTFVGEGSITAERLEVYSGTTYNSTGAVVSGETAHIVYGTLKTNGDVTLSSDRNAVDPSGVLDVESGTLTFTCGNRALKGTVFVRRGATLAPQTTDAFNYGGTQEMHIYGTLAMGSTRWTTGGGNTIYLYGGSAVTGGDNTQGNIDFNADGAGHIVVKRNMETGDTIVNFSAALRSVNNENGTIEVDSGVTLVMSGKLIDRQKITKRGAGSLVFDTPEGSEGGYIWVNEGTVGGKGFVHNITMAPRTVLQPELEGLSVNGFWMPEDSEGSIVLNSGRIDPERLSGSNYTLLTVKGQDSSLEADRINVSLGSRYESTISDKTISVTVKDGLPTNFLHYDFNNGATEELAAASDSGTIINYDGEADGGVSNGKSVKVCTGYTPYWDSYVTNASPFASQEITVTTVAKMKETGVILWGLGNTNDNNPAFGLVALSANKVAIVTRNTAQEVEQMLTVDNTEDLTKGYHFFAIVANATGTTLYVDNLKSTTSKILPMNIGQRGQIGSFHGGEIGANKVSEDGFRLDDWAIYDSALKQSELKALRSRLTPRPFYIRVR